MKISKNISLKDKKEATFDAIVQALFEGKNLTVEGFDKNRTFLVSLDETPKADLVFDYAKYCEGEIGERIVIKQVAQAIFGQTVDPRPLTVPVRKILESYMPVKKVVTEDKVPEKSTLSFSPEQKKQGKIGFFN
jgi:hypothetical protein